MSLQLSGGTLVNTTFTGDTRQAIVTGLEAALASAGWSTISGGGSANVKMESAATPSGFKVRVRLIEPGSGSCAQIKLLDSTESFTQTGAFYLNPGASKTFRVIACRYQFFIFVPGPIVSREFAAVGCPYIPAAYTGVINQAFWAHGNAINDGDTTLRNSFRTRMHSSGANNELPNQCYLVNSSFWEINNNANANQGSSNLVVPSGGSHLVLGGYRWHDGNGLLTEPLIAYGDVTNGEPKIRGQLWNALLSTTPQTIESSFSISGNSFFVISNDTGTTQHAPGSLLLVIP